MQTLIVLGVVGFFAQLVDGASGWRTERPRRRSRWPSASRRRLPRRRCTRWLASIGFLLALGSQGISWTFLAALLVGGIIAAPIAAWLVRLLSPRLPGACVGGMIVVTNARTIMDAAGASGPVRALVYVVLGAVWVTAIALVLRAHRRNGVPLTSQQWVGQPASSEAAG